MPNFQVKKEEVLMILLPLLKYDGSRDRCATMSELISNLMKICADVGFRSSRNTVESFLYKMRRLKVIIEYKKKRNPYHYRTSWHYIIDFEILDNLMRDSKIYILCETYYKRRFSGGLWVDGYDLEW